MRRRGGLVLVLLLFACAGDAAAQSRIWRHDERINISSFNDVTALAYDGRRVFAATLNGLEIYDAIVRRWLPPSTIEDGYPIFERPLAIAYDRGQGGLWLRTANNIFLWSDLSGRWDLRSPFDMPESLRGAPAGPERDLGWRVLRGSVTLDAQARRWPLTAVVPAEREGTYWVGTGGGNILFADTRNLSSEWLPYGTLTRGTSALAIGSDGSVWFGGDGLGPRYGVTRADAALDKWQYFEPAMHRAPRRQVRALVAGTDVWAGTSEGVDVLRQDSRSWQHVRTESANVRFLTRCKLGICIGTSERLGVIDHESLRVSWPAMPRSRINGLAERNDTLWIASDNGLFIATERNASYLVSAVQDAPASVKLRAYAVAHVGAALAVLAADGLYILDDAWTRVQPKGDAHDLRADEQHLYVLGNRTLAQWHRKTNQWQHLTVPGDIPAGPVRDVVRSGEFLWVATPAGAMRLKWP